jgi:hypothetical protein
MMHFYFGVFSFRDAENNAGPDLNGARRALTMVVITTCIVNRFDLCSLDHVCNYYFTSKVLKQIK